MKCQDPRGPCERRGDVRTFFAAYGQRRLCWICWSFWVGQVKAYPIDESRVSRSPEGK